jgi:hypothetical protein
MNHSLIMNIYEALKTHIGENQMRVKSRYSENVIAVKIQQDLLAEAGNYLIIGNDDVAVMSQTDFDRLFVVNDIQKHTIRKMPPPPRTRYRLSADQNILLAFGPGTDGYTYLKDMTISSLTRILPRIPPQRLLEKTAKLIREKKIESRMDKDQLVYNITEDGKEESRDIRDRK